MTPREKTHQVTAGNVKIGGGAKVSVQSMTNTDTRDAQATLAQIERLYKAGAAPTLLYQGGKPRWLGEDGLPVGILGQVRGRELRFGLAAGDLAVLFSDGALADGPEWAAQQLGLCAAAGNTPQEMADLLADGAVRRALPGRRRDDVTVAVLRLDKTP